jgi:hypothetical protein
MPALLEYVLDEALPDRDEILDRLGSHDRDVVLRILTLLCPCRNACYDVEIWARTLPIWTSGWDHAVREAAHHALGTVHERARVDVRSRQLLHELAARTPLGIHAYPDWFRRQLAKGVASRDVVYPKPALRDVPTLIELLSSDDRPSVDDAVAILCPADGRHPSKRVWRAILDAQRSGDAVTRTKAARASAELRAHLRRCQKAHE